MPHQAFRHVSRKTVMIEGLAGLRVRVAWKYGDTTLISADADKCRVPQFQSGNTSAEVGFGIVKGSSGSAPVFGVAYKFGTP